MLIDDFSYIDELKEIKKVIKNKILKNNKFYFENKIQEKTFDKKFSNNRNIDIDYIFTFFDNNKLLQNREIWNWILGKTKFYDKNKEDKWGKNMLKRLFGNNVKTNWSTMITEHFMKELLRFMLDEKLDKKQELIVNPIGKKRFCPDIITENYIFEIKARTWHTSGTAGEKILGTPKKYSLINKLTNKKLFIVLLAYQEQEANDDFRLFDLDKNKNKEDYQILELFYNLSISYIRFSDLIRTFFYL